MGGKENNKKTGWAKWLTWAFVAEQIAKGMFNAVGSVFVYVAIILLVLSQAKGTTALRDALSFRAPALSKIGAPPSGSG